LYKVIGNVSRVLGSVVQARGVAKAKMLGVVEVGDRAW